MIAGAATYPDWVVRAREQLDAVCGKNAERLPQWSDFDSLSYITAVVKESFRWRPNIAPLGAPTSLIKDDEYEGYRFPSGTIFTWNAWYITSLGSSDHRAIALSEKEYKEPMRYWPERFMDENLNNALQGHWGFGPGKSPLNVSHSRSESMRGLECRGNEYVDCHGSSSILFRFH